MLTDTRLKNLKPADKTYKVPDRNGLYALVLKSGTVSFHYNYRVHGQQETLVLGQHGTSGLSLQEARARLREATRSHAWSVAAYPSR